MLCPGCGGTIDMSNLSSVLWHQTHEGEQPMEVIPGLEVKDDAATDPCEICHGEALGLRGPHPTLPLNEKGCQCGPGVPCVCNPDGKMPPGFKVHCEVE
jgi:hypothetical protein